MRPEPQALFLDFDGTIAETERHGHRVAYQAVFDELGLGWTWDEALYGKLLAIAGGKERIEGYVRDYGAPVPAGADLHALIADIHERKRRRFSEIGPSIPLRPGIARLIAEAKAAGWKVAIVTTASPDGVEAVLASRPDVLGAIDMIAAGDVVAKKKPAPDIYAYALEALGLQPHEAIAIEDSAIGLRAALAAGVPTLVTRSSYTHDDDFAGARAVVDDLGEPGTPGYVDLAYLRRLVTL